MGKIQNIIQNLNFGYKSLPAGALWINWVFLKQGPNYVTTSTVIKKYKLRTESELLKK